MGRDAQHLDGTSGGGATALLTARVGQSIKAALQEPDGVTPGSEPGIKPIGAET